MSLGHGSSLVRDGLVVHIDGANPKSYSGTGTLVKDLSGRVKNGTTVGSGYNAVSKAFTFDGVNDTISFGTGNTVFPLPQISHEFLFRSFGTVPTTGTFPGLCGLTYGVRGYLTSTGMVFGFDDGTAFPSLTTAGTLPIFSGQWFHVTNTHDGTNWKLYVNGKLSNSRTSTWLGTTRWPTDTFNIGRDNNNVNLYFYGEIAVYSLYNKVLTATEVAQNFEALRGRYGI